MFISILICTYNRCESLKDTLESLYNQKANGNLDYEIVVVDNNSKDKTKEIVSRYLSNFNGKLRCIFESKQGISFARNAGAKEARGEIVAFIDDDCIAYNDWLININNYFEINPEVDGVLGDVVLPNAKKIYTKNDILRGNGMNMCFRKKLFEEIGYFDFYLGTGTIGESGEETEFMYRAKKKGKKIVICNEIKIIHKHRISEKQKLQFLYRDTKGYVIFLLKHVLKEGDVFALKKIYWHLSGFFIDLLNDLKKKKREGIKLNFILLSGCLVGLIKGLYIWLFFVPLKSLCRKSA